MHAELRVIDLLTEAASAMCESNHSRTTHGVATPSIECDLELARILLRDLGAVRVSPPERTFAQGKTEEATPMTLYLRQLDLAAAQWLSRHGASFLRAGLAVVYIWFGALKFVPGLSPAEGLIERTVAWAIEPALFLPFLAMWECVIGLGLWLNRWNRAVLVLLLAHMGGTALPCVVCPELVWSQFPCVWTLEGQYILKNLVLIGGALTLAGSSKISAETLRVSQPFVFPPVTRTRGLSSRLLSSCNHSPVTQESRAKTRRSEPMPRLLIVIALVASVFGVLFTVSAGGTAPVKAAAVVSASVDVGSKTSEGAADSAAGKPLSFEIAFGTHLDMNLPEQDVFIERVPGSGEVFRVTTGDHNMKAPLFKTAVEVKHNPFDPNALGPHPKGEEFGMTLGQWLKHQGTGKYTFENGEGHLDLQFSGLVPNGVYTMWHSFIALPPTEPFSGALDLPLGARDGSESVFVADASGEARFKHSFHPGLEMSDVWTTSMLAINYHSDGKTYGGVPGSFGLSAHVPLFVLLPNRDGI